MIPILKLFRFPLVFTAVADSLTGYIMTASGPIDPRVVLCLGIASAGLYCFGMAMNDIADRERDKTINPGRPLPSGKLSLPVAIGAAAGALFVSFGAVILAPAESILGRLLAWGGMLVFILAYDFGPKIPPLMGAIRALNVILGAVAGGSLALKGIPTLLATGVPIFVYVTGLTFASTMEEGKIRKPLLFGWAGVMALGAMLTVVMTALFADAWGTGHAWALSLALTVWIGWRAFRASDRKGIMLLVRDGVAGIIVVDASLLLSARIFEGFWVLALLIPAALMVAWFKKLA